MATTTGTDKPNVQMVPDTRAGTEMEILPATTEDDPEENLKSSLYGKYLSAGLVEDDARFLSSFSKAQDRAIYRKVDYRFVISPMSKHSF